MPESRTAAAALSDGLSNRQVTMISIAGIIGAGLFIGSANAIAATGPAILLSYAITGLLVLLVMRMLGEMAVLNPDSGSFSTYATQALGQRAGFTVGWLYWWFWVLLIPVEAIAGADILHAWFSAVPSWAFTAAIIAVLTATNLLQVKNFGEFEFWFSLVKVLAIVAFIAVGALAVFGAWPLADVSGVRHLFANQGFMPHGFGAVLTGILVTMFSFFGAEIVTIAAAESKRPAEKIRRAINLVVWRIALFYLLSIFLVVSLVNWSDPGLRQQGTFQYVLTTLNMPGAKLMVDVVVFVAVCSCMNSGLYTASRMLFSLARRGDAPAACARVSAQGVPRAAVIASTLAGFAACVANYAFPGRVFTFLISTTGAIALLVYLVIAASQLVLRRRAEKLGQTPAFRMWLFPWLTWAAIAVILAVLGYMFALDDYREQGLLTLAVAGGVFVVSLYVTRGRPRAAPVF
ncbi:amino acid permease [Pluralibacter gergoviae]|uniref:Amino acid permease n=1 Tax=Pluralibacter gergoviae TaxID=61647 RepID=A0AAW8HRP7_PLUGE|nr:amino acid permease [Pluralibacter gergoviae]AVR04964.1 GABA permease [Pluralibacter gergoviae]MDQ2310702.1 amino acid permease [Pluralibacter gergoviae]